MTFVDTVDDPLFGFISDVTLVLILALVVLTVVLFLLDGLCIDLTGHNSLTL